MGAGQKGKQDAMKRWAENNPERAKIIRKKSSDKWRAENREKINKQDQVNKNSEKIFWEIRKKHHEDMKDDPESLTCDFMDTILELDSDDYESLRPLPLLETLK